MSHYTGEEVIRDGETEPMPWATSRFVIVTTCGCGPEIDDIGPVYGPFDSEADAAHFASQLPDVVGYENKGGSYWTDHQVHPLSGDGRATNRTEGG